MLKLSHLVLLLVSIILIGPIGPLARADESGFDARALCPALLKTAEAQYAELRLDDDLIQRDAHHLRRTIDGARRFLKSLTPADRAMIGLLKQKSLPYRETVMKSIKGKLRAAVACAPGQRLSDEGDATPPNLTCGQPGYDGNWFFERKWSLFMRGDSLVFTFWDRLTSEGDPREASSGITIPLGEVSEASAEEQVLDAYLRHHIATIPDKRTYFAEELQLPAVCLSPNRTPHAKAQTVSEGALAKTVALETERGSARREVPASTLAR